MSKKQYYIFLIGFSLASPAFATNQNSDFETYLQQRNNVEEIANKLFLSNNLSCPIRLAQLPAYTDSLKRYPRKFRRTVRSRLGLSKHPTVTQINGQDSGFFKGDIIIDHKDRPTDGFTRDALNDRQAGFVRILRNGEIKIIAINGPKTCPYKVEINHNSSVNAKAKGIGIRLNQGLLDKMVNDHERALIIGHEFAHLVTGHSDPKMRNAPNGIFRNSHMEDQADRDGLDYMINAGFNPYVGIEFWKDRSKRRYNMLQDYIQSKYASPKP